ncbi:MAG: hypothetical protein ACXAEF_15255 [Candidatus Thorarchaeota archaeon]|jgi:hypothetical protein
MDVNFEGQTLENMKELAEEAGLTLEGFIEIVMEQFVDNKGGRVYTGRWSGGEVDGEKGFRYVPQWPFRPGFKEAKGDQVKKWKSGGKKYRPHPTGAWPFYPHLEEGDIEHEYWSLKKNYHTALMNDRKGRIVVLMENAKYEAFLEKVKEKKGNFWANTIDAVLDEAINDWMKKEAE